MTYSNHDRKLNVLVFGVLSERYFRQRIDEACSIGFAGDITEKFVAYIQQMLEEISDLTGVNYRMDRSEIRTRFQTKLANLESEFESKIDDSLKELQVDVSDLVTQRAKSEAKNASDLIEKVNKILNNYGVENEINS